MPGGAEAEAERIGGVPASGGAARPFAIGRVAVIGAGQAGRAFALLCAAAGFDVVLEDVMPSNLRRAEADYGGLAGAGRLGLATTVEEAVCDADVAVDFVPDELESKLEIFSLLDRMAPPRTILLTPSEALSITDLASCVYRPERCFGLRGGMPGVAPKVRLLHAEGADAEALGAAGAFVRQLGAEVSVEADPDVPMLVKNAGAGEWRFPSSF